MPGAGGSTRAARRYAAPWWEELDTEAFREFPAARRPRIVPAAKPARSTQPRNSAAQARPVQARSSAAQARSSAAQARSSAAPAAHATAAPNGGADARDGAVQTTGGLAPATGGAARAIGGLAPATDGPIAATDGRRTVTIRGYGAHPPERNLPVARPTLRRHERPGFQPDRAALWAVILGLVLIFVAAASAHAAVVHQLAH